MMLACKELTKYFSNKTVLNNAGLELEEGRIYALLGQNGSGKTTLMKIIAGLVKPNDGEVLFEERKIGFSSKKEIAYMPTENYFYDYMKVSDAGRFYSDFYSDFNKDRFAKLLDRLDIDPKERIKQMSSGQIAKLKLAVTISRDAKLYLLDEPLNGIDLLSREQIITIILEVAREDNTIVISSHLVDELEKLVDHVIFMNKGMIQFVGDAEEIREVRGKSIAEVYRELLA